MLGIPETVAAPGRVSLVVLIAAGLLISIVVTMKVSRAVLSLRSHSRDHAQAARLIGSPTARPNVFVLTAERPAASTE